MTEQGRKASESSGSLDRVLQVLKEIAEKSADGDYLYRGESKYFCRISSTLYRECKKIGVEEDGIGFVQKAILDASKEFIGQADEINVMAQLQHFGFSTNFIDFTTDCLIALFFACDGRPESHGRVVLLQKDKYPQVRPPIPANRVIAQKSIFVHSARGFVEPNNTVKIPKDLKTPIKEYLEKYHGIAHASIYNDLHGFIKYYDVHKSAYVKNFAGLAHARKGEYKRAIEEFNVAIKLNPLLSQAYNNRGNSYTSLKKYDLAILDFNKAIELSPGFAVAHCSMGNVFFYQEKYDLANREYDLALAIDPGLAVAFYSRGLVRSAREDIRNAILDFTQSIELDPSLVVAYDSRGIAFLRAGAYLQSILDFNKVIEAIPNAAEPYSHRGTAYRKLGDYIKAIEDFDKAIELGSKYDCDRAPHGVARSIEGEQEFRLEQFPRLVSVERSLGLFHYNRSECWLILEEWAKAKADLSTAKSLGVDVVSAFRDEFGSVAAFEEQCKVRLPECIVTMLSPVCDE